jgi:hypothetical protein
MSSTTVQNNDQYFEITTSVGVFNVPNYDSMTQHNISVIREIFKKKFQMLNDENVGYIFPLPEDYESILSIDVRFQQAIKKISECNR